MDTMNGVVNQFNSTAVHYAAAIHPYALKVFLALFFIDVLVTAIQFMMDQGDAPHYIGKLFRHALSGGFIYLMIVNAFAWMTLVMQSFGQIGSAATGLPNLNPSTVLKIGGTMAQTIFNTPASAGLMPNLELAIVESASAFFILLSFVIAAAALLLTLIESYLVIGGAVLLLGFGGSRLPRP
jgi:type IV secretion system protein TrbL